MEDVTFETLSLSGETLGDDRELLTDNLVVKVQKYNGNPIAIEFPSIVEMTITQTEEGARGNTASGSVTKPATTDTGLEIQVPLFIKEGERVKVHTETREFAGRA
jgi:elongation factor P